MNCGGHLVELVRTKAGLFYQEKATKLEDIKTKEDVENLLVNPLDVLDLPMRILTDREKEEGCTTKWVDIEKAIDIFSSYPSYLLADLATAGLYKRELLALEEYLDLEKKNRKDFKGK